MIPARKTLAAIDAAIIANQEPPFRAHLGASLIGKECARRIWYDFHWTKAEAFEARMLRLFGDGHHLEPRVAAWLKQAGVELWQAGEFGTDKSLMRISACAGHFGGTPDFIGKNIPDLDPDEPALIEVKTHNNKSFDKIVSDGIMRTKWEHFVQMQVYMGGLGLKFALYIPYNKDTSAIHPEIVQFDQREYDRAIARAESIIFTQEPPPRIGKNPGHYGCKYCHLNRLCYFGDVEPARNCRTCQWSTPAGPDSGYAPGTWICDVDEAELNEDAQRAGCDLYTVSQDFHKPA